MQVPTQPDRLPENAHGAEIPASFPFHSQPEYVYDLRLEDGRSDCFFKDVARFTSDVMDGVELRAASALDGYSHHVQTELSEAPRSRNEYALDLLTLGMALRLYGPRAERTTRWAVGAARVLLTLRQHAPWIKPAVDWIRGLFFRAFWAGTSPAYDERDAGDGDAENGAQLLHRLPRLIAWLRATGELEQEAIRVANWRSYLGTLELWDAVRWMDVAGELFSSFEREADGVLGIYAAGVEKFLATEYAHRRCRADQIFCGKSPAEYYLNMVAAEVMNLGLREGFDRTARKVVLVPACMRGARANKCRARVRGVDMTCTACDPECTVNYITRRMRNLGAAVYLVPHNSGFGRWLDRWEREPGVGVVAVACMLNIVPGGYEMRSRRIASQCVPLDYPGCKKHWDREGIPTAVNEDRLVQIVATPWFT